MKVVINLIMYVLHMSLAHGLLSWKTKFEIESDCDTTQVATVEHTQI